MASFRFATLCAYLIGATRSLFLSDARDPVWRVVPSAGVPRCSVRKEVLERGFGVCFEWAISMGLAGTIFQCEPN